MIPVLRQPMESLNYLASITGPKFSEIRLNNQVISNLWAGLRTATLLDRANIT
jgi:hypothetical protein